MKEKPTIVAKRMKELREGIKLSQAKLAACLDNIEQTAIFRYESGQSFPPYGVLMQYADFFDVSLDYIFGRCDKPQGKLYDFQPKVNQEKGKMELSKWIYKEFTDASAIHHYAEENYLDENIGFELVDFDSYYIKRREKIRAKLIKLLDINIDDNVGGEADDINENEKTTLANTIFKVLKQHPEGMTIQEIYDEIIKHSLYEFGAENPKGVMYITIQRRCIGSEISKQNSIKLFKIIQVIDKDIYYGIVDEDDSIIT